MTSSIPTLKKSTLKSFASLRMTKAKKLKLAKDPVATAEAIQLVYVSSKDEGIERAGAGKGFNYLFRNKIMHYRSELVWKQIQYIAELLDNNDLFCLG